MGCVCDVLEALHSCTGIGSDMAQSKLSSWFASVVVLLGVCIN